MRKNLPRWNAILRVLVGSVLFYYFVIGGPTWMVIGLYLMLSGSFRFCALHYYLARKKL